MAEVTIYTTRSCPFCKMAKEYFDSKNVQYAEIDVSDDPQKQEEAKNLAGMMAVPVIKIGEKVILGFDKAKIDEALAG